MAEIKIIRKQPELPTVKKVAAYTRVSSDKDAMLHSLSNQVSYFSNYIQSNKNWIYAGVYSDEGQTGTNGKRDSFQRMIQDAKEGKIDIIITKSISRFARNTETLIKTIRELKEYNVDVYFQEQNIHTLSNGGELLISILASYAQEESRTCSENTLWRVSKNFQEGKLYGGNNCLGYKIMDGNFVLVPEEAVLVKRIFDLYIGGYGEDRIAKTLNDEGIKSYQGKLWYRSSIRSVLTNYNYTGDLLLQKTYRENHITKKMKRNNGEKNMYLVSNDHEPIISKDQFEQAKKVRYERLLVKSHNREYKTYPFTGLLRCGICGRTYTHKKNEYIEYWVCSTFEQLGKSYCNSKQIRDDVLKEVSCQVLNIASFNKDKLKDNVSFIEVFNGNKLNFHFYDESTKEVIWQDVKRSSRWTDEMREKARLRAIEQHKRRKAGGEG